MTHALGRFLIEGTTLPAGSAGETSYRIFTAGGKAVEIQYIQYHGGDSGESLQLFLMPANVQYPAKPSAIPGSIAITPPGGMRGATGTPDEPATVTAGAGTGQGVKPFVIPPFYSLSATMDSTNTAAYYLTIGGFEINA